MKARFQYQRTSFPQISGDGSAYIQSVGGHVKLVIRVANDGAGRPLVCQFTSLSLNRALEPENESMLIADVSARIIGASSALFLPSS